MFLINPVYESTGHRDPADWEYHQLLASVWMTAQYLVLLGLLLGIAGWRSLSGKIGTLIFLLTAMGVAAEVLLSYLRAYRHF